MSGYVYQPVLGVNSFDDGFQILSARFPNRVRRAWVAHTDTEVVARVSEAFAARGIPVQPLPVPAADYNVFRRSARYEVLYPDYYRGNLPEKSLEQFLAIRLLGPTPEDTFVDLASEHSPLPDIVNRLCGSRAFAQDMMYPPGVHGNHIGGDACAMPLEDGFISKAALTCSLEHFEGDADIRLFRELARVVRPGGHVAIIPLYMFTEAAIQTDPRYSASVEVPFDGDAAIYCAEGWANRHGRFYTVKTLTERILQGCSGFTFTVYRLMGLESIAGDIYARFALLANRL